MQKYSLIPVTNRENLKAKFFLPPINSSILSFNLSHLPVLSPKISNLSKRPEKNEYIAKVSEVLNSFPPSISVHNSFKYSRLSELAESSNKRQKNYFLKPIVQKNKKISKLIEDKEIGNPRHKSISHRVKLENYHQYKNNRVTVLSKVSDYSTSLGMSDSDSSYSEENEYCLTNKLNK